VKEETKASSSSVKKSTGKGEEAMEWDADTKDVLQQLLRDDVTYFSLLLSKCFLFCTVFTDPHSVSNEALFSAICLCVLEALMILYIVA